MTINGFLNEMVEIMILIALSIAIVICWAVGEYCDSLYIQVEDLDRELKIRLLEERSGFQPDCREGLSNLQLIAKADLFRTRCHILEDVEEWLLDVTDDLGLRLELLRGAVMP